MYITQINFHILTSCLWPIPANMEPFLNQLARVILVHNWYRSSSTCFHVCFCSACCHKFWTSLTRFILGQNWYAFTGTCHHVKNSWFHSKHVSTHNICSQNPVNSRTETHELSQSNSWIHLQNIWNHRSLFAGMSSLSQMFSVPVCDV